MEITVGGQISLTATMKINNFKSFTGDVRSKDTDIFPGKKIAIVIKKMPESSPGGTQYITYSPYSTNNWTIITEKDRFLSGASGWRGC